LTLCYVKDFNIEVKIDVYKEQFILIVSNNGD